MQWLQKNVGVTLLTVLFVQNAFSSGEIRKNYQVYKPQITLTTVDESNGHDATIVFFDGQWIAQWDDGTEKVGQKIKQSMSNDLLKWSKPIDVYSTTEGSSNPVTEATLWQPSLVVKNKVLYSFYKGSPSVWMGKLTSLNGKWENTPIYSSASSGAKNKSPQFENSKWDVTPLNNGIVTTTGRIIVPVALTAIPNNDQKTDWMERLKKDSIIYSDDDGKTWEYSNGIGFGDGTQSWEATVWQSNVDTLNIISRNNRLSSIALPRENLKGSLSLDGGKSWEPQNFLNIDSAMSRPHVIRKGERNILVQNDWFLTRNPTDAVAKNRRNLSLYFSRGSRSDNFVAGLPILDGIVASTVVDYPQVATDGNSLVVIYSRGYSPRITRVAKISPAPIDSDYYIFPRLAHGAVDVTKLDGKNVLRFNDDYSSAGIDIDAASISSILDIMFSVKLESSKRQTIFSLSSKVKLVADSGHLWLLDATPNTKNKAVDCGLLSSGWSDIFINTSNSLTTVKIGKAGAIKQLALNTFPWQPYFGDDVYSEVRQKSVGQKFSIAIDSIITRVK